MGQIILLALIFHKITITNNDPILGLIFKKKEALNQKIN